MLIAVAHQKGGVGKSTLATNFAIELELPVVDLDSQHSVKIFSAIRRKEKEKSMSVYTPETIGELKEVLKKERRLIVDSGGYDNDLNRYVLAVADYTITPVAPSQIEVFGLLKFQKIVEKAFKINPKLKIYVVINNALPQSVKRIRDLRKFIEEETPFKVFDAVIHRRMDYQIAYMEGLSVCELNPKGKACYEFKLLLKELLDKFNLQLK